MITSKKKSYLMSAETVDILSQELSESLTEAEANRKDIIRLRISLEEILENWLSILPNAPVTFLARKRMGKQVIEVRIEGKEIHSDDMLEGFVLSSRLLAQAGLTLTQSYKNGENCLTVYPPQKQKMGQMQKLLIAIVTAICLGLLQRLLPEGARAGIQAVTDPLFTLILNLLRTISSPMIFLAICWGIFNIGDMTAVGKIGKKVISRIIILAFLIGAAAVRLLVMVFSCGVICREYNHKWIFGNLSDCFGHCAFGYGISVLKWKYPANYLFRSRGGYCLTDFGRQSICHPCCH